MLKLEIKEALGYLSKDSLKEIVDECNKNISIRDHDSIEVASKDEPLPALFPENKENMDVMPFDKIAACIIDEHFIDCTPSEKKNLLHSINHQIKTEYEVNINEAEKRLKTAVEKYENYVKE